nr:splicing factor [Tanacetum cinerariifolium]
MVLNLRMKFQDNEQMKIMNVAAGRYASEVDRKGIKETVAKGNGKEKVAKGKGKDKVVEGKGKKKVVEGSTVDADAKAGRKKWTKQGIKMARSPSKKGIKKKTSYHVCNFRLWGSLMQNEASFQIKTLSLEHNCAWIFDFESLVTYKWIARQYAKEIISNPKISYIELQAAIREKFLINVSLRQCRKAKQSSI